MTPTRRQNLKWMFAALTAIPAVPAVAVAATDTATGSAKAWTDLAVAWPDIVRPVNAAMGYGTDPDLMAPSVPWPLILSDQDRATLNLIGDIVLPPEDDAPGAGQLDIAGFIDEWISAPYEGQASDRKRILNALVWLDAQSVSLSGKVFAKADPSMRMTIVDALMANPVPARLAKAADAFGRLRGLIVGGYYTLPEGKADIGYVGNTPMSDYPGPSDEALVHLRQLLTQLNLPHVV